MASTVRHCVQILRRFWFFSTDPITGTGSHFGAFAIHVTANDLAAAGADPVAVMLTALLPESIGEPEIRAIVQDAEAVCEELNMEIIGGHTEVTDAVGQPLLSVTGNWKNSGRNGASVTGIH